MVYSNKKNNNIILIQREPNKNIHKYRSPRIFNVLTKMSAYRTHLIENTALKNYTQISTHDYQMTK